jgi:ribosomal protein S18 acetylase RimI-like enzyme
MTLTPRRLAPADLDAVVTIDHQLVGRHRRAYFQRRLEAALKDPDLHVQFAVDQGGALAGYVLARRLAGEFGRVDPALRLEVIGVRPEAQGHGLGDALLAALSRWAKDHGIREIRTQASWRDHAMLRFFDHGGFQLAENQVMDCDVIAGKKALDREPEEWPADLQPAREVDYGAPPGDDYEALARDKVEVSLLAPGDAALVARIDRKLTGRDRGGYIELAVREALSDSAVRVSLIARSGGAAVGFVMAKTDLGDYGRTEPVAVLDNIGVDPAFAHHRVGTALLSQLFVNLAALQVERVETVVARENFGLLGFLYRVGFGPSPRLGFVKRVA